LLLEEMQAKRISAVQESLVEAKLQTLAHLPTKLQFKTILNPITKKTNSGIKATKDKVAVVVDKKTAIISTTDEVLTI
jgi:hypothetical protein